MATIVSTPVQIPSDGKALQLGSQVNPFYAEVGSSLYQVLFSSQGTSPTNTIRILKRATADTGGAWVEMDAANSPDQGSQSGAGTVSFVGTTIAVAYLLSGNQNIRICEFDTGTDTWGSPTASFLLPATTSKFVFVQRSDLTYVVIGSWSFRLFYIKNTGGVWSALTNILLTGGAMVQGVIDSSNNIWFLFNSFSNTVGLYKLSSTYALTGSFTTVQVNFFGPPYFYSGYPSIILWNSTSLALAWRTIPAGEIHVKVVTPLSAPVATEYTVYLPAISEKVTFYQLAAGTDTSLNLFFISANPTIPSNQIIQSVFDGASAWSTSIFYDAISNPPMNGLVPANSPSQVMQTLQAINLAAWTATTAMVTNDVANPPATFYTAEFLEADAGPTPPGTISCQIIITPPGPPGPGQVSPKALRYQIPQRRWFPHTYND